MPVTAKLSKLFYDRLGEEIADELVDWFNAVDATYRADLREINELNFTRFDAKLEQRVAQLHARLETKMERLAAELNAKIDRVAAELNARIDRVAAELNTRIERVAAELRVALAVQRSKLIKWMFVFWAGTVLPLAVLMMTLLKR